MSWFFLLKGNNADLLEKVNNFFQSAKSFQKNNTILFYEGRDEVLINNFENDTVDFVISGIGIIDGGSLKFADKSDWAEILNKKNFQKSMNGHFAGCCLKENSVFCFNDILGLREIYYTRVKNTVLISSRADLLTKFIDKKTISAAHIAGHWLTSSPLFYSAPVNEIKRLGPGGRLEIDDKSNVFKSNINITYSGGSPGEVIGSIESFTRFPLNSQKISLGLSGGLDSRTLLAVLSNSDRNTWQVHTFGSSLLEDVSSAAEISESLNLRHMQLHIEDFSVDDIIKWIKVFLPFTGLTVPVSDLPHINYHKLINDAGYMIMDGGFGEIGRRQFLNRLLLSGNKVIRRKNTGELVRKMTACKPNIFSEHFSSHMQRELSISSEIVWDIMERFSGEPAGNWLDRLMVAYKLPNVYGYGQHCLDQISAAYMPFAQQSLLQKLLSIPSDLRSNGKLYREIIAKRNGKLKDFDLVKDYVRYPYSQGTVTSYIYRKIKRKIGSPLTIDPVKYYLFDRLKDYIYDEIYSKQVKEHELYDHGKIESAVREYYKGNKNYINEIDWWLTFNEWYKINFTSR